MKTGTEPGLAQPGEPTGAELLERAAAAYLTGAIDEAVPSMEQAYRVFLGSGDKLNALRTATSLVRGHETLGNWGTARGWEQRGWRLLDDLGPCVERGYHELAWVGCDVHDPEDLLGRADRALAIAREFKDHQLELRAEADKGLALVSLGRVDEGFGLMDEVAAGISAGELPDPLLRGLSFCALMSGCERTGDRGRAEVWGHAIETDPQVDLIGLAVTHCELVHGSVDALRGKWEGADQRLTNALASAKLAAVHRQDASSKLAQLRIQQGRYDEAEELLRGLEDEFEAAPAVAALYMARGEHQRAAGVLRSYTRGLGSDCLRLAPALAQLVDLELWRGDQPAAARASQRLQDLVAGGCDSPEVRAVAEGAAARMAGAAGDHDAEIRGLEKALGILANRERPFLAAQVRLDLGRAFQQAGEPESGVVEVEAALSTFERLGVVPQVTAARALLAQLEAGPGSALASDDAPVEGRYLATVLFTDIVGSTEQLARLGDRAWKELLDEHDRAVHQVVGEFRGRVVNHTGDGILATFDGPNSAIHCARALQDALGERGIHIRTGLHAGEVERRGANIGGIAVHTAARVMAKAEADEILVSSTVRDLVAGSGLDFSDRGEFELKGLPGTWRLWALGT